MRRSAYRPRHPQAGRPQCVPCLGCLALARARPAILPIALARARLRWAPGPGPSHTLRPPACGHARCSGPPCGGPALPQFFARYPDMVLELGSSDHPVDLIAEGVDCVIRGVLVHDETLVARPLGNMQVLTCAAPSYLARYGTPTTLQHLDQHRFLNFHSSKTGRVFPFDFAKGQEVHQVHRPHWVSCSGAGAYVAAGLAGMGIMQSPRTRQMCDFLTTGQLVQVLPDWSAGSLPLMVLYPRNRHLTAKVNAFALWAKEVFDTEFAAIARSTS